MARHMRLRFLFFSLILFIGLAGMGMAFWLMVLDLPTIDSLKNYRPAQSTIVFDRNGHVVGRFYDERRTVIALDELPPFVKLSFIAAEDGDFFEHSGIDYIGLMRAVLLEIKHRTIGGRRVGGSTITQQTARTMLLTSTQTYVRKLKEIVLAYRIEKALSKDEILHLYLNQIYFGNGAYGIEEAAQTYFLKPASKLKLFEATALASIPKSPNRINPFADAQRLRARQHYVLDQMVKRRFIRDADARAAKAAPLFSSAAIGQKKLEAPYFLQAVRTELARSIGEESIFKGGIEVFTTLDVRLQGLANKALQNGLREIDKRQGYRGPLLRPDQKTDGEINRGLNDFRKRAFTGSVDRIWDLRPLALAAKKNELTPIGDRIRLVQARGGELVGARISAVNDLLGFVTIDLGSGSGRVPYADLRWAMKKNSKGTSKISDILRVGDIVLVRVEQIDRKMVTSIEQDPEINGGLVVLDIESGGILAMVGGYDFSTSSFNRITQARRQPGSLIKPLIYALAADREVATAATLITDAPKAFFDPGTEEFWLPRNHDDRYRGDITLRHCLRSSINQCTLTLLERIGLDAFLTFAKRIELSTASSPMPRNLTIGLGSAENHPINVANAMRIIANSGYYSPYRLINGVAIDKRRQESAPSDRLSVLRPEAAFVITNILTETISEAQKQKHLADVKCQLAGKTGTTNNARSTWFMGYSPKMLALVYTGYDDNRSIGGDEWGITTAFPIWANFMRSVPEHREEIRFAVPPGIEWRLISRKDGRIKGPEEAADSADQIAEAFIAGTAPEALPNGTLASPVLMEDAAFMP